MTRTMLFAFFQRLTRNDAMYPIVKIELVL
jgi:hypothetical protein